MRMGLFLITLLVTMPSCGPACRARGGRYIRVHFGTKQICDMPAKDAGRSCRDSGECENECLCRDETYEMTHDLCTKDTGFKPDCLVPDIEEEGTCAKFFFRGGLLCTIENGRVAVDYILVD